MATQEQKAASEKVMVAVQALNDALSEAGAQGLHIELRDVRDVCMSAPRYIIEVIETRETVFP